MAAKSKKSPLVYVVTPVFNGRKHTEEYLQSLKEQEYKNFKVVIVDDGSTDDTGKMVREKFPDAILLEGDGSLWWSGGTNLGARLAVKNGADYVLTLNNDLTIKPDYIEILVLTAEHNRGSIVGSMVCYKNETNKVWYFGAKFGLNGDMDHVSGEVNDFNGVAESEWLTGMGVLVPARAFDKAGYYDEVNYPQYFGDAEFSLRAKKSGYKLLVVSEALVLGDINSSWVHRQLERPSLRFFWDLFFSVRSPYQIKTRVMFYKEYWPRNYILALLKLYLWTLKGLYISFFIVKIKKFLGINKPLRKKNKK